LQVKRIDSLGKEYLTDASTSPLTQTVSYLKLINVPCMFDAGCVQACPSTDALTLNMVDDKSFRVERTDFLSKIRKFKPEKIEKFTNALKAIHTTMAVAEAVIYPYGVVRGEGQKPTGLFSKLKGGPSKT